MPINTRKFYQKSLTYAISGYLSPLVFSRRSTLEIMACMSQISIDQFKEVDLRVGTILTCERVPGSEKLLRLHVDVGEEKRQILAGIGKSYEPEALINRQIVIVANLAPRSLMGLESQGMVLAAGDEEGIALLSPDKLMAPGSQIR
jgi:methionyl-tRNA synthetase